MGHPLEVIIEKDVRQSTTSLIIHRSLLLLSLLAFVGCGNGEKTSIDVAETSSIRTVSQEEVLQQIEVGTAPLILDVRTEREYQEGHVPGAILIPHTALTDRLDEIVQHKDHGVVVYCKAGTRASFASKLLTDAGFKNVRHLDGDMSGWIENQLPVEQ